MKVEFIRNFKCYEVGYQAEVREAVGRVWVEHGLAKEINDSTNKVKGGAGGGVSPPFPRLPAP